MKGVFNATPPTLKYNAILFLNNLGKSHQLSFKNLILETITSIA